MNITLVHDKSRHVIHPTLYFSTETLLKVGDFVELEGTEYKVVHVVFYPSKISLGGGG